MELIQKTQLSIDFDDCSESILQIKLISQIVFIRMTFYRTELN